MKRSCTLGQLNPRLRISIHEKDMLTVCSGQPMHLCRGFSLSSERLFLAWGKPISSHTSPYLSAGALIRDSFKRDHV
jgi:hypothetical protein